MTGERARALLAVLTLHRGADVGDRHLIEELWAGGAPANPVKALQVVVSRTRAATRPDAVVRTARGYRLGLRGDEVDALLLADLADRARAALDEGETAAARRLAEDALALDGGGPGPSAGPLADLRAAADARLAEARRVLAVARARDGDHAGALPLLEERAAAEPYDEDLLVWLLRSEAAVRGAAAALERYERYRSDLADRLGAGPGAALARVHAELLAADRPVREGVLYDGSSLLGRDEDIRTVHALLQTHRVVSVVGPGGLGKTRLAHVVARNAVQPAAYFVELVAVSSPEGVVGEVGSALGVRDSVTGMGALTPRQRADVRTRIARHLDRVPSLLVLDNCEHVVEAVADLVAFLVASTRDLRVLTTSRAPLAITAERVHPLGALAAGDAADLFAQRATAARPDVRLDTAAVRDIVTRLDGLPLAIELAAAKVRVMAVEEIRRRLGDRFALLRGGDRTAPDRHRTLLAVIDWSWNLLGEPERRALRRMALFADGFTLETAEDMLGSDALEAVHALVEHSLLGVRETGHGLRYRMLETVREFGLLRLEEAGEAERARAAQRDWAARYCARHAARLFAADQFAAVDALHAEEGNLADLLRRALAEGDRATVVRLLGALGALWSIRGDHSRIIAFAAATARTLTGWTPPPELEEATRASLAVMLLNTAGAAEGGRELRDLLTRLPDRPVGDARLRAMAQVALVADPALGDGAPARLAELGRGPDRETALLASLSLSLVLENAGELTGAAEAAERALSLALENPDEGPWTAATVRTTLAQLALQHGDLDRVVHHARAAIPVMARIGAVEDEALLRSLVMFSAVRKGEPATAEAEFTELAARIGDVESVQLGPAFIPACAAELALARGETADALAQYRLAVGHVRRRGLDPAAPITEPFVLLVAAMALTAHAHHADPADVPFGAELSAEMADTLARGVLVEGNPWLDYPVAGAALFALGTWDLLRGAAPPHDAVRLLVLAERFAYQRMMPSMAFERIEPHAERAAPGALAALRAEYGDRRGPDLVGEAGRLVRGRGSHVPLVAAHGQRGEDGDADQARQ